MSRIVRIRVDGGRCSAVRERSRHAGGMSLAVCLLFDSASDLRIRRLWQRLEELGVGTLASHTHQQHHPHLSYAVLRDWDLAAVRTAVQCLPDRGPLTLSCQGTVVFPRGRVALAPAVSGELASRQEQVVAALQRTGADLHKHYRSGHWLPHISIATRAGADQLAGVTRAVADVLPVVLRCEQACLIDSGTGQRWGIGTIP